MSSPRTRKRFIVLAVLFGCVWINYMNRTNISIAGTTMRDDLGIDPLKMGLIFSAFSWTYGWLQIPAGALVDVFRTRRFYAVIMFFWSAMTALTGFANSLVSLIGLRLGLGLFQAPSYPAHNKMVTRWFPTNERASAIAVYTSAQFLVLAFMPIIFVWMMNAVTWRGLFIITGIVSIKYDYIVITCTCFSVVAELLNQNDDIIAAVSIYETEMRAFICWIKVGNGDGVRAI